MNEFYNGSLKEFVYTRKTLMADGRTLKEEDERMTVQVKPGFSEDTVLTFPKKGNQAYAYFPSCLKVKFQLKVPAGQTIAEYARKGDDLIYTHSISFEEAIMSRPIKIKTLD